MWILKENYVKYQTKDFVILTTTKKIYCNKQNLLSVLNKLRLPKSLTVFTCEQVHGSDITFIPKNKKLNSVEFLGKYKFKLFDGIDGIITEKDNSAICIFTADCVPLFLYDIKGKIYGLIHIGRRGILSGIVENIVKILKSNSLSIKDIKFVLGPHICKKCYIVDKTHFSLKENIIAQLKKLHIKDNQISYSEYCTYHNHNLFFSYRRNDLDQRMVSIIYKKYHQHTI